jgi:hypothetical protein
VKFPRDSDSKLTKVEWLDLDTAAQQIGRSVRRTLSYATAGKIRTHKQVNPRTNREVVTLHAGDVEHMRAKLHSTRASRDLRALRTVDRPQAAAIEALSRQAAQPERFPLLLTFSEAARYLGSGIPSTFVRHLAETGQIEAIDVHPNAKTHWFRVRKADIERYANFIES